jgi:hypothetical protein
MKSAIAVAVLGLAAAGCGSSSSGGTAAAGSDPSTGPLFSDSFQSVCQGATQSRATTYETTAPTHKALYFESYTDDLLDESSELPADWTIPYDAKNQTALTGTDLVACGVRTASRLLKTCTGYQDKGKDTDDTVDLYAATYTLSVHEAATGTTLASRPVTSDDPTCPTLASFGDDHSTVKQYDPIPKDTVIAALKQYVQP